jgi:HSP20 family protein
MPATKKRPTSRKKAAAKTPSEANVEVRSEPAEPARRLMPWQDLDRLFDDFLKRRWAHPTRWEWPGWQELTPLLEPRAPSVDVVDQDNEVVVRAEVPGVDKKDLDVSIADRTLTIKGSKSEKKEQKGADFYRQEIRSGSFSRSVLLPADVDSAKAKASYKDGVVELRLPKTGGSKRRKVPVA